MILVYKPLKADGFEVLDHCSDCMEIMEAPELPDFDMMMVGGVMEDMQGFDPGMEPPPAREALRQVSATPEPLREEPPGRRALRRRRKKARMDDVHRILISRQVWPSAGQVAGGAAADMCCLLGSLRMRPTSKMDSEHDNDRLWIARYAHSSSSVGVRGLAQARGVPQAGHQPPAAAAGAAHLVPADRPVDGALACSPPGGVGRRVQSRRAGLGGAPGAGSGREGGGGGGRRGGTQAP